MNHRALGEIGDDLDLHPARLGVVLPEGTREGHDVLRERVQVDRGHPLLGRRGDEREQAPHRVRGAPGRLLDDPEVLAHAVALGPLEGELSLAEDDREQVVELVGDAARDVRQRPRLLGLDQLFLRRRQLTEGGVGLLERPGVFHRAGHHRPDQLPGPDVVLGEPPLAAIEEVHLAQDAFAAPERHHEDPSPAGRAHRRALGRRPSLRLEWPVRQARLVEAVAGSDDLFTAPRDDDGGHRAERSTACLAGPREHRAQGLANAHYRGHRRQLAEPLGLTLEAGHEPVVDERRSAAIGEQAEEGKLLPRQGFA